MNTWLKRLAYVSLLGAALSFFSEEPACGTPGLALTPSAASWSLTAPQPCAKPTPADRRIWAGTAKARLICRAVYGGSPEMRLTLFEMPGGPGGTAFDAFQRWRRQPGKMAFYKGHYFGVVESSTADTNALDRFIGAVETTLPQGSEAHW